MEGANALKSPVISLVEILSMLWSLGGNYLVRSKLWPSSSSRSSTGAKSRFTGVPFLMGLVIGAGAGLLLGGMADAAFEPLTGLDSKLDPFMGVFPRSAYFQNGAGELVGMC
jgi:hypothetical protein